MVSCVLIKLFLGEKILMFFVPAAQTSCGMANRNLEQNNLGSVLRRSIV